MKATSGLVQVVVFPDHPADSLAFVVMESEPFLPQLPLWLESTVLIMAKPRVHCTNCSCLDSPGFLCLCCCGGSDFSSGSGEVTPYREPHPDSNLCPMYALI